MELTEFTAEGTVHFWPPINQERWDTASASLRNCELALLPADETDLGEVYNGKPMFFPKYDHNGLHAFTFYDQGNTVAITARLATFIAAWTDTSGEEPHPVDPKQVRTFSGRINGTGPEEEPNLWGVRDSHVLDLRLHQPDWLLFLIETQGKSLIEWALRVEDTDPYGVPSLDESVAALAHEMSVLCPGIGGAIGWEVTHQATFAGITDAEYDKLADEVAGSSDAQAAWAIAIVAKALGLAEAWTAHLATLATERRVKGDLSEFAVQAKVITAPHRNQWDDEDDE